MARPHAITACPQSELKNEDTLVSAIAPAPIAAHPTLKNGAARQATELIEKSAELHQRSGIRVAHAGRGIL